MSAIARDELLEWFVYVQETGLFYWKKRPAIGGQSAKVGDVAGTITKANRRMLWLRGRRIYAGRAAYIMVNGEIPDGALIDHIDGDTLNDRLDNLRLANAAQNTWNRIGSHAMAKGVVKDVRGRFKARIARADGGKINLGTWDTEAEAHAAYMGAAAIMHGDYWLGNRPSFQQKAADAIGRA